MQHRQIVTFQDCRAGTTRSSSKQLPWVPYEHIRDVGEPHLGRRSSYELKVIALMPVLRTAQSTGARLDPSTTYASDIGSGVPTSLSPHRSPRTGWPTGTTRSTLVIRPRPEGRFAEEDAYHRPLHQQPHRPDPRGRRHQPPVHAARRRVIHHIFTAAEADDANFCRRPRHPRHRHHQGDLLVATASLNWPVRGVGANATVLQADSVRTNGLKWGTIDFEHP